MIPDDVVETINQARVTLRTAIETLSSTPSFLALTGISPSVEATLSEIGKINHLPRLQAPCSGRLNCTFVAAPGLGKLAALAEMFPHLAERGWLSADEDGPLTQALCIRYAASGSPDLDTVSLYSWSGAELKTLIDHPQTNHENHRDAIQLRYAEDAIYVDGNQADHPPLADSTRLRFPRMIELRPFVEPYPLRGIQHFRLIRALTRKLPPEVLDIGPLLVQGGHPYHALQLRAMIKHIELRDPFERLLAWSGAATGKELPLDFILVPETTAENGARDEILRNVIARKARQRVVALHNEDELDVIVYLVSCGQTAGFAELWRSIADECDPAQAEQLAERLIVAVTDTHRYFTDRDIRTRYEDPAIARHIGDHFVATLEENILQRLNPHGPMRPARICFVDSELGVETAANTPYQAAYERYQKIMTNWSEPGKIGHETLSRLGLMESFAENTTALADPEDRGQGFLLRQILALGRDRGPALLLGKYLVRTGLLPGLGRLLKMLTRHYDPQGRLRPNPAPEPRMDGLLGGNHAENVDVFALRHLDPRIETMVRQGGSNAGWAAESFRRMCALLKECMAEHGKTPESAEVFARRLERQMPVWIERWGYAAARLTPTHRGVSNNAELLNHCLKLHAREILHELGESQLKGDQLNKIEQDPADRRRIAALVWDLKQARMTGLALCRRYGVRA